MSKLPYTGVAKESSIAVLWRSRRGVLPHAVSKWPNEAISLAVDSEFVEL